MNDNVFNLESEQAYNPYIRAAGTAAVVGSLYGVHRNMRKMFPEYNQRLYDWSLKFEERSPFRIGRTFHLSEKMSSYLHPNLEFTRGMLVGEDNALNSVGKTFQRQFGDRFDILSEITEENPLRFGNRKTGSAYLDLLNKNIGLQTRFTPEGGTLSGVASRLDSELSETPFKASRAKNPFVRNWENFRSRQHISNASPLSELAKEKAVYLPFYTRISGEEGFSAAKQWTASLYQQARLTTLSSFERTQKLLSDVGLGLPAGTWNKTFHIPFIGEGGLLNQTLTKRVLPITAGLTVLGYLNYKLGHPANKIIDLGLKANVLRADLTDQLPGARAVTDTYEKVVPGAQYGPLALPLAGVFFGGVYHYSKVLRGLKEVAEKEARTNSARILPNIKALRGWVAKEGKLASVEGLSKIWSTMGLPGKGGLIGLATMLPFIPGMLGSRKSGQELRDIYSGVEPVPIRSGRWWEMGSSEFRGNRIKEWRPHWSLLHKSHARDISLYGSEDEKWSHNPILHPLRYLRDPYWLEKKNYSSRPYPISSPAFSNVPLVGPLLAATIGRLVKPEVRMHEDEWDTNTYDLYSSRLEPRSFRTESKLERNLLEEMSKQGFVLDTQESVGNYRVDFSARGNHDRKIAIEADGVTYHRNKAKDSRRQTDIEKKGWTVLRLSSTDFFSDPEGSAKKLGEQLKSLGVHPTTETDRDIKSGLRGLASPKPGSEYSLKNVLQTELKAASEYTGLIGFINRSLYRAIFPKEQQGKSVAFQGSRQMDSISRQYYEKELGAGMGPGSSGEPFGYTEPLRRFIQPEDTAAQANELQNEMPSWIPGEDSFLNLQKGDPYAKVSTGWARLPGEGYASLHPEVEGLNPEDYPDINKLSILADVAPYSKEYQSVRQRVQSRSEGNTELKIEYEKILERVKQIKESVVPMDDRHFTGKTDTITGTVSSIGLGGVTLEEHPNQRFQFSSIGFSAADLSAQILGEKNNLTRSQVAQEVNKRRLEIQEWFSDNNFLGKTANITVPSGAGSSAELSRSVISIKGINLNKELLSKGYGNYRKDLGGAESGTIFGPVARTLGSLAEGLSFQGDSSFDNPMRYIPSPAHTKLWQERTPLSAYINNEVIGTRMRRWERPIHDFLMPYFRGAVSRLTGDNLISKETQDKRDLNTLTDSLRYLQDLNARAQGTYTSKIGRTSIGANQFSTPIFLASTLSDKEGHYFNEFISETDQDKREKILGIVSPEMRRSLETQWATQSERINGGDIDSIGEGGRLYTEENLEDYKKSGSKLDYGNYVRSKEIANFFSRTGFTLPGEGSQVYDNNIDYEDIKLKVIQQEGYDAHDFNIFDDRASLLWRKPYLDGAVRELTSGDTKSAEDLRIAVEQLMIDSGNRNPDARTSVHSSPGNNTSVKINVDVDNLGAIQKDIRLNREKYKEEE